MNSVPGSAAGSVGEAHARGSREMIGKADASLASAAIETEPREPAHAPDHAQRENAGHNTEPAKSHFVAVIALAFGIFTLVTIEELPIGVLTLISDDLKVSEGTVGLAVTLPGVLAGIIALLVPSATRALNRKTVLLGALIAVVVSCAMAYVAPTWPVLLASRFFTGIAIGMYWPVLPMLAAAQVRAKYRTTALTIAYSGTGSALVLGLPLVTWLGTVFGWRGSFAATGILAAIVCVVALVLVRPVTSPALETLRSTLRVATIPGVRYAFVLTLVIITGQFITYSYVSPILQSFAQISIERTSVYLLLYGVLGIIGNFVAGPIIHRSPNLALLVLSVGTAIAIALVGLAMHSPISAMIAMGTWGLFGGMASVSLQSLVNAEAGDRVEAGTALNSAAYNISIGGGAVFGGVLVDHIGLHAPVWVSLLAFLAAVGIVLRLIAFKKRGSNNYQG